MFIELKVLKRRGSNTPPEPHLEIVRVDLIQRMREVCVTGWDSVCTEIQLDDQEVLTCTDSLADVQARMTEIFTEDTG